MLVAAAVCPCPPLLVPEVAAGAAPELDTLRAACADAVGVLAAARPERLVVVGPAPRPGREVFPPGAVGSFRGYGVAVEVTLGQPRAGEPAEERTAEPSSDRVDAAPPASPVPLPSSLAVAAWLLRGWQASPVEGLGVGEELEQERCAVAGQAVADAAPRVALLVMGDGSACRTVKAPGYLDERAEPFDAAVAAALGAADTAALEGLDAALAQAVQAAGRAPWQVLAGAARGAGLAGELLYDAAPYGVGYFVATWT
ncbi:class III extradiol dioxygenase subunit B-like domain-containing protein [Streptomyces sp. NBC_00669]|uniref:class III extradiol dioxygenase subunit B-like domain-containing protein n=1 Tax=Streptomyces sp. NBC_00669 TaxID=2976011 RepID=UPI002E32C00E|nr:class III extradiol dioxygenase subunit B-like domain-containing protein [Streptomyces sp. NBC_00669]